MWAAPKLRPECCWARATQEMIFWAMTVEPSAWSISLRQMSQALQLGKG